VKEQMMEGSCENRVVVITGAGRGLGREYALAFARQGAKVVVNDLGSNPDGSGVDRTPAQQVVDEITGFGGTAVANADDVSNWQGARRIIDCARESFGGLDVLVNNAGILRDRMLVSMTEEDWDSVTRVHLKGTAACAHHAAAYWRDESKAGRPRKARLINTGSSAGLYCHPGQSNYGSAKAAITALTVIASRELERYGVTVNAIYPTAWSRLTQDVFGKIPGIEAPKPIGDFDPLDAANVAPVVVWLGSERSSAITGRVFGLRGGRITVAEGWRVGPRVEKEGRWTLQELDSVLPDLHRRASPNADRNGEIATA
jgi:NAD(P)-dependent dehydrogenase (short-subunit alcohol dehydrogenase family)